MIIDCVGNALTSNDLVVYTDEMGHPHLCLVGTIIEKQGLMQLQPLWITLPFDPKNPHVLRVVKVQKPPQFQKGAS